MELPRRSLLAAGGAMLASPALAQRNYPARPIRLIVPWLASAAADIQLRGLAQIASRHLGQPIVIENRAGASGILGAQLVANEGKGDAYLLTQMHNTAFRVAYMMQRPPYDLLNDFTYVIRLVGYSYGVVVRPDSPWRTWQDFVRHVKDNPGRVSYGTAGVGTTQHITMEQIGRAAKLDWVHVPFRGGGDDLQSLMGGNLDAVASSSLWAEMVQNGQLRLLVSFGEERIKRFPQVPTLREEGIDVAQTSPYGLVGPKGMDPGAVRVLHDALHRAMREPEHLALIERLDMPLAYLNSADYAASIPALMEEQKALVRDLGLRM
ncbi:tripartite tricarboxylate transporter substrate binding protein [Pseudoroseomonas oryzae]|uniref:Tripartite tricarboxylate transporter substrate binding protein n=2 Tax=Teichococcus oryzae TaxID=1608942 RepID=A0A5B2TGA3_9PROT|nr:tripartite tricarboxylate transporter substrate binding protein [Pseudoroseomonas oryzae]